LACGRRNVSTAQLNRQDTLPKRLSPGQIVIPSLCKLTNAADFTGRLDLYNGEFVERGGGWTAVTYVDDQLDVMVVDVKGADPKVLQSAELRLWSPRKAEVALESDLGALAETWQDTNELGSTGLTFGSLAAITSDGENVHVEAISPLVVKIAFRPHPDGSFRVFVASPAWQGGDVVGTASTMLEQAKKRGIQAHREWWNKLWKMWI